MHHITPRERQVLLIVGRYLDERGQRCFSYDGIYAFYERCCRDQLPATTLDRTIRKLVEKGLLERREVKPSARRPTSKRRTVIFCWTDEGERVYRELRRYDEERERRMLEEKLRELLGSSTILHAAPKPEHELEFFATGAPDWWPYHVVTIDTSLQNPRGKTILHDNGAFKLWRDGSNIDVDVWVAKLARSVNRYAGVSNEVRVVLPDRIGDPTTTVKLHEKAYKVLCKDSVKRKGVKCVAVVQMSKDTPASVVSKVVDYYLTAMPEVDIIAVPCKAPFATRARDKLVVRDAHVIAAVGRVFHAARYKRPLHALAPQLKIDLLKRIAPFIASFDTTSWTRPITGVLRKLGIKHSAKDAKERELMFAFTVAYLNKHDIPIKRADLAMQRLPRDILDDG